MGSGFFAVGRRRSTQFTVLIPVLNAGPKVARTLDSVLANWEAARVNFHIQDGGSTDGTLEHVKSRLGSTQLPSDFRYPVLSLSDDFVDHTVVRGYFATNPESSSWFSCINAGDELSPDALSVISTIDKPDPSVSFVNASVKAKMGDG